MTDPVLVRATPSAPGGIGIIILAGERAAGVLGAVFRPPGPAGRARPAPGRVVHGGLVDPRTGTVVDDVLVTVVDPSVSLTGEPAVELDCHGGLQVVRDVVALLVRLGAEEVTAAEYQSRARERGRMDRIQEEAYPYLEGARTARASRFFLRVWTGALSQMIQGWTRELEGGLADRSRWLRRVKGLLARAPLARSLAVPPTVVLAGRPNVGKSTLFNALIGEERAVVTEVPGTTRDTVAGQAAIEGVVVRVIDGAGIRGALDPVELEGVRRALGAALSSDLVLHLSDRDGEVPPGGLGAKVMRVRSKADLGYGPDPEAFPVSALTGEGVDGLRVEILHRIVGKVPAGATPLAPFNDRQVEVFSEACRVLSSHRGPLARGVLDHLRHLFLESRGLP